MEDETGGKKTWLQQYAVYIGTNVGSNEKCSRRIAAWQIDTCWCISRLYHSSKLNAGCIFGCISIYLPWQILNSKHTSSHRRDVGIRNEKNTNSSIDKHFLYNIELTTISDIRMWHVRFSQFIFCVVYSGEVRGCTLPNAAYMVFSKFTVLSRVRSYDDATLSFHQFGVDIVDNVL